MSATSTLSPQAAHCQICPLNGSRYVPGELGSTGAYDVKKLTRKPKLVIVGEGPGYTEQVLRRPFVGRSGKLLDATLTEAGLSREDCFVTNSHACMPQSDEDAVLAAECCAPRLHRELAAISPEVPIVALGKAAAVSILGVKSILLARGFVWTARPLDNSIKSFEAQIRKADKVKAPQVAKALLKRKLEIVTGRHALAGRTVLPTIHPAFVLRSDTWNAIMAIDFDRISRWVRGNPEAKRPPRQRQGGQAPGASETSGGLLCRGHQEGAGEGVQEAWARRVLRHRDHVRPADVRRDPLRWRQRRQVRGRHRALGREVTRPVPDSNVEKEDRRIPQWIRV